MKSKIKIISTILMSTLFNSVSPAQGVLLGNSSNGGAGFVLASDSHVPFGGAIEFTPLQDFNLASITVWLVGYTGLDLSGQPNSIYAEIFSDGTAYPGSLHTPGTLIAFLDIPPPNDGSLAPFTLNLPPIILSVNTPYWLLLYAGGAEANIGWVGGDNPVGNAIYNGSENFYAYGFYPSSITPAFRLNAAPEPGQMALSFLCAGIYAVYQCRKFTHLIFSRKTSIADRN
jgi:hypothetical protein